MKKTLLLFAILLSSTITFSQDNIYVIVDQLKAGKEMNIYEVKNQTITSQIYENREVDNPEYLEIIEGISKLETEILSLKGSDFSESEKQSLQLTRKYLKQAVSENTKKYLKSASEEISKTKFKISQITSGKKSEALVQAKDNISKIDDLLGESSEKENQISNLNRKITDLKRKAGIGYSGVGQNKIPKTIRKDVATGEIEREIMIVETINLADGISGEFQTVNNGYDSSPNYYLMNNSYQMFVKNELVPRLTISKYTTDSKINEITDGVSDYSFRYNDTNSYLFKSVDNGKIYYTNTNALGEIAVEKSASSMYKTIESNDIKITTEGRKTFVSKNGNKCVLTDNVKEELAKGNANIVQQMQSSVNQYDKYYKQAISALDVVNKHYQSYQSRTMTKSRLAKWKVDTKKLISINDKMNDIHYGKYKNDTSSDMAYQYFMGFSKQLTREQVQAGSIISDMIRESKIRTGI
tara:strand:- start:3939 stop:5342 length:1404 start_codon:yes stop_codon:yes gene_type:complete